MRSRSFYFHLIDEDFRDLWSAFQQMDIVALAVKSKSSTVEPLAGNEAIPYPTVLLTPRSLLSSLARKSPSVPGGNWTLNVLADPVIELGIPRVAKDRSLRSGRLYFVRQTVEGDHFVEKGDTIQAAAAQVLKWARRWVRREAGINFAPHALEAWRAGLIEVVPSGYATPLKR